MPQTDSRTRTDAQPATDGGSDALAADVADLLETATKGDRVLFNDRVQPLTVRRISGPYDNNSSFNNAVLEGPRGGRYTLIHRDNADGLVISFRRQTGYSDDGFRTYEDIQLSSIELVDHHRFAVGQVFEEADPACDEFYHVVTGIDGDGCYDVETVTIRVRDGAVASTGESGFFHGHSKERLFDGDLQFVETLSVGYSNDRGVHYDTERGEEVRLSGMHKRGVDCRPLEGSGLEIVDWDTVLFGFQDRFGEEASE